MPTDVEAVAFLNQAVALAAAGNFDELCALGGGNCEETLEDAGRDAVPSGPPLVLRTWLVIGSGTSTGGRILEVCGIDGRQRPYRTQILVFPDIDGDGFRAIEPVYWSGMTIAAGNVVGPQPTPAITCPGVS
jgi:hypothetical protein